VWIIGAASLLAIIGGGISAGLLYEKHRLAPERLVADYLSLVVDGRVEKALTLSGGAAAGLDTRLLTDEANAAASNRVSGFAIGPVDYSEAGAAVSVKIRQASTTTEQTIRLVSSGKEFGVIDVWDFKDTGLASVRVAVFGPDL
jgi:Tfp pilus assembly major pilin PilA